MASTEREGCEGVPDRRSAAAGGGLSESCGTSPAKVGGRVEVGRPRRRGDSVRRRSSSDSVTPLPSLCPAGGCHPPFDSPDGLCLCPVLIAVSPCFGSWGPRLGPSKHAGSRSRVGRGLERMAMNTRYLTLVRRSRARPGSIRLARASLWTCFSSITEEQQRFTEPRPPSAPLGVPVGRWQKFYSHRFDPETPLEETMSTRRGGAPG